MERRSRIFPAEQSDPYGRAADSDRDGKKTDQPFEIAFALAVAAADASDDFALVFLLALASLRLHFVGSDRYGFFRDELYYIACGNHLALGYVDQPPLIGLIARLSSLTLGTTLSAFRFFPALAGACLVLLTSGMTRELGGGRFAQALACLTVLLAPVYLAFGSFLSMNAFEPLFWMTCAYILVRILKGSDQRLWLLFGLVAGIGLQNKHTMLMFGAAVVIGIILASGNTCARSGFGLAGFSHLSSSYPT